MEPSGAPEPQGPVGRAFSAIGDFLQGAVVDNGLALLHLPGDALYRALGASDAFGDRDVSWDKFVANNWRRTAVFEDTPARVPLGLLDALGATTLRTGEVALQMLTGLLYLTGLRQMAHELSGGRIGLPAPDSARNWGQLVGQDLLFAAGASPFLRRSPSTGVRGAKPTLAAGEEAIVGNLVKANADAFLQFKAQIAQAKPKRALAMKREATRRLLDEISANGEAAFADRGIAFDNYIRQLKVLSLNDIVAGDVLYPLIGVDFFPAHFARVVGIDQHGVAGTAAIADTAGLIFDRWEAGAAELNLKMNGAYLALRESNEGLAVVRKKIGEIQPGDLPLSGGGADCIILKGFWKYLMRYAAMDSLWALQKGSSPAFALKPLAELIDTGLKPGGYIVFFDENLELASQLLRRGGYEDVLPAALGESGSAIMGSGKQLHWRNQEIPVFLNPEDTGFNLEVASRVRVLRKMATDE